MITQEEINVLAAEFNLTPEGNEPEIFAKALSLCQKFKRERDYLIHVQKEDSDKITLLDRRWRELFAKAEAVVISPVRLNHTEMMRLEKVLDNQRYYI